MTEPEVPDPQAAPTPDGREAERDDPAPSAPARTVATETDAVRQLAERTADLQRLQAEYLNYKRRVDRDREVIRLNAAASVLVSLLPVLDDIGRADSHGELTGGFKAVADSLQQAVAAHGLESFGQDGDAFDPTIHEALMHGFSTDVDGPTADKVLQVGYRIGDRILRPARVSVVEPGGAEADEALDPPADADASDDSPALEDPKQAISEHE